MKILLLCSLLSLSFGVALAQEEVAEEGAMAQNSLVTSGQKGDAAYNAKSLDAILPRPGDIAFGLDASPILNYFGNMFNNSTNNDPKNYLKEVSPVVYVRYHWTDCIAFRGHFQWMGNKKVHTYEIEDQLAKVNDPMSKAKVEDRMVARENDWKFGVGAQYFRGYGRLRGFVGADLVYSIGRKV